MDGQVLVSQPICLGKLGAAKKKRAAKGDHVGNASSVSHSPSIHCAIPCAVLSGKKKTKKSAGQSVAKIRYVVYNTSGSVRSGF